MLGELDSSRAIATSAEARIRESLAICTDMGSDLDRAACLTALGGVEALRGRPERGCDALRPGDALRSGAPPEAPERAVLDRFYASSRR